MEEHEQYQEDKVGQDAVVGIGREGAKAKVGNAMRGTYQDGTSEDGNEREIVLFGGKELILTDIDNPYAFDSDTEEIRMENVRKVAL